MCSQLKYIEKKQKKAVVTDMALPSDSNIKMKCEKLDKYQALKEEL